VIKGRCRAVQSLGLNGPSKRREAGSRRGFAWWSLIEVRTHGAPLRSSLEEIEQSGSRACRKRSWASRSRHHGCQSWHAAPTVEASLRCRRRWAIFSSVRRLSSEPADCRRLPRSKPPLSHDIDHNIVRSIRPVQRTAGGARQPAVKQPEDAVWSRICAHSSARPRDGYRWCGLLRTSAMLQSCGLGLGRPGGLGWFSLAGHRSAAMTNNRSTAGFRGWGNNEAPVHDRFRVGQAVR